MTCRELTPDYLSELRATDVDDLCDRIGCTLRDMADMSIDDYFATVRRCPIEFFYLLGNAEMEGRLQTEDMQQILAALPDDVHAVYSEAKSFIHTHGVEFFITETVLH